MSFEVQASGRVCLFGEHSDYFGLDVIPAAIDMSIRIIATPRNDNTITIEYQNTCEKDAFAIGQNIPYRRSRDYVRGAFNVMRRIGISPKHGWHLEIKGNIPIAAGLSSSSALTTAAILTVARMSGEGIGRERVAELAFLAEVAEFKESGGKMDHYASAYGGLIHLAFEDKLRVTELPAKPEGFVIGDSLQKKHDTVGDLRSIKETVEGVYQEFKHQIPEFDRRHTPINQIRELPRREDDKARIMAVTTLRNRDLTERALKLLGRLEVDSATLGSLLNEHHMYLRDGLGRSTPKIENLIERSLDAGALGCKINGSGGGGTILAYAPGCQEDVAKAIQEGGGTPYIVEIGKGASLSELDE